jgi:hypothetical protein
VNLHAIAAPLIGVINPLVAVTVAFSLGTYTQNPDRSYITNYSTPVAMQAQVQPLGFRDLMQTEGLNLQGTRFGIYVNGTPQAIVRFTQKGGDLITLVSAGYGYPAGTVFLTAMVLETYGVWSKLAATLQNGS